MEEEARELSNEEMDDIAGGKIRVPLPTITLMNLVKDALSTGQPIDWVLSQCKSDRERDFVRKEWDWRTH